MSLFPAYGGRGGRGGRGWPRHGNEDYNHPPSGPRGNLDGGRGWGQQQHQVDRRGGDVGRGRRTEGMDFNPIDVDDDEGEEGEVRTPNDSPSRDGSRHKKRKRSKGTKQSPQDSKKSRRHSRSRSPRRSGNSRDGNDRHSTGGWNQNQGWRVDMDPSPQGSSQHINPWEGERANPWDNRMPYQGNSNFADDRRGSGPPPPGAGRGYGHRAVDPWNSQDYARGSRNEWPDRVAREPEPGRNREGDRDRGRRDDRNYEASTSSRDRRTDPKEQEYYENQRQEVSRRFPKKMFIEEVNLKPEFAFRIDTGSNQQHLKYSSLNNNNRSAYFNDFNTFKVMGASDQELTQIYNKFSKFRTVVPDGIQEDSDSEESSSVPPKVHTNRPVPKETIPFLALPKEESRRSGRKDDRIDISDAFENRKGGPKKEGELSMKEKIEMYNKRVREEPRNVELWKEFVEFQDKYFDENEQVYGEDDGKSGKKKRRNKKALLEKKIAILEKALESNPKNFDLQLMRLNHMYTLGQPSGVLDEWRKLASVNQQNISYWVEYFRFATSELQVFSIDKVTEIILETLSLFRRMLSPNFPDFQRHPKHLLVISDIQTCFSLIFRNAGLRERSVALHQGQLETDFCSPELKSETLLEWKENKKMFEMFWDSGTAKFGENEAPGWRTWLEDSNKSRKFTVGISDTKVSEFEDSFFECVGENKNLFQDKVRPWLILESSRSKFQWLPWRQKCSDIEEVDDSRRIVLGHDIASSIIIAPTLEYFTNFHLQSAYFRHVVNYLLTLQEDFLPQTQTVASVMNPLCSMSLTESRSLSSELFYWRRLLSLYAGQDTAPKSESQTPLSQLVLNTPEGFRVPDWTSANNSAYKCDVGRQSTPLDVNCPDAVHELRKQLLLDNEANLLGIIRNVVGEGIERLEAPFSSLLLEMYIRFEQKNTVGSMEKRKARIQKAKSLLQKPSVRNSIGPYLEIATLEYCEGNKDNAVDILIRTINESRQRLNTDPLSGFVDVEAHWEIVAILTKMYTRLAEFHLVDKPQVAYYVLSLLGSGFNSVSLDDCDSTASNSSSTLLKAMRQFERILGHVVPGVLEDEGETTFVLTKEMLERWGGDNVIEYMGQQCNIIVEWTSAYAMFKFLAKQNDFESACQVYESVIKKIKITEPLATNGNYNADLVVRHHIREQLYINWCNLGAHVLSKDPMANSKFRNILGRALEEYPSSPPLLLLFTDVEDQMSIAGKLWRLMVKVIKQDGACNHWAPLFMGIGLAKKIEVLEHDEEIGLSSFGLGGPAVPPDTIFYKLDSLLCAAQENRLTRICPLVWRIHLKLLALRTLRGKDVQRAKTTFYEAIRHCPSAKALYLDGICYFPELFKEITDLMAQKKMFVRIALEELDAMLEVEEEAGTNTQGKSQNDSLNVLTVSSDED